jgi:predicted RNA-binding Zn-ribbon protein involved in translation (DUF1610 family)
MATGDGHDDSPTPPDEGDTAILPGAAADIDPADPYDEANAPEGTLVDAPAEPLPEVAVPTEKPPVLRRKRRELDRRRQRALLDLGGLVVEMARRERMRVDLLKHRAAIVLAFDAEIDAIDQSLAARRPARSRAASAAPVEPPSCPTCGTAIPAGANYCPSCGTSVLTDAAAAEQEAAPAPAGAAPSEP